MKLAMRQNYRWFHKRLMLEVLEKNLIHEVGTQQRVIRVTDFLISDSPAGIIIWIYFGTVKDLWKF